MKKMNKTNEIEADSELQKNIVNRVVNQIINFRPAGIFGFLFITAAFYVYRYIQVSQI